MPHRSAFALIFAPETLGQLEFIEPKYYHLIQTTLNQQLRFTPDQVTRNRKLLE